MQMFIILFCIMDVWKISYFKTLTDIQQVSTDYHVLSPVLGIGLGSRRGPKEPWPCLQELEIYSETTQQLPEKKHKADRTYEEASRGGTGGGATPRASGTEVQRVQNGWSEGQGTLTKTGGWAQLWGPKRRRTHREEVFSREAHVATRVQFSQFSSVQLQPRGLQHARLPCPSPTPGVYPKSCRLSEWCRPTISSSVVPFSSCLQSFPASGPFQMSQFFTSGGQSIGVSALASVLPMSVRP